MAEVLRFTPTQRDNQAEGARRDPPQQQTGASAMQLSQQQLAQAHSGVGCAAEDYLGTHRVLLVDDDPVTLRAVEALLRKFGYLVITATNARDAIRHLETSKVDLVLTDVLMPEVSGFDLMHEVMHGTLFSEVPVVVMSSHDSQEAVLQAFEAGAADYLIKPIRRNEVATLWQHVWRANRFKTSAHPGQTGQQPEDHASLTHVVATTGAHAAAVKAAAPSEEQLNSGSVGCGAHDSCAPAPTIKTGSGGDSGDMTDTDHGSSGAEDVVAHNKGPGGMPAGVSTGPVNSSGPSSDNGTTNNWDGGAAGPRSQHHRLHHSSGHGLQASDNADTCTDAAMMNTSSSQDDDDEGCARDTAIELPTSAAHHHRSQQQQVTSGVMGGERSSHHHHHAAGAQPACGSAGMSAAPAAPPAAPDVTRHHHQQQPTRPICGRSCATQSNGGSVQTLGSGTMACLQELACLGQARQDAHEREHHHHETAAATHHKAQAEHEWQQQQEHKREQQREQQRQADDDADTAEAAGLLLGVAAAAAAEHQARRGPHLTTMASHGRGHATAQGNAGAASGLTTSVSGGAVQQDGGNGIARCSTGQAAAGGGHGELGHSSRSAFSALTVILPRGYAANAPAPSTVTHGDSPAFPHHQQQPQLQQQQQLPKVPSHLGSSDHPPSFNGMGGYPGCAHPGAPEHHTPCMPSADMRASGTDLASQASQAAMFMHHPGAQLMLPQSVMPLLAYSLAGMHHDLNMQHSMFMQQHGQSMCDNPGGYMDASGIGHQGMPPPGYPSVVLVAGRNDPTSSAAAHRRAAVQKYLLKKKNRNFKKKVRYESRKRLAEARPRVRGQFVKQDPTAAAASPACEQELPQSHEAEHHEALLHRPSNSGNKQGREENGTLGPAAHIKRQCKQQGEEEEHEVASDDEETGTGET